MCDGLNQSVGRCSFSSITVFCAILRLMMCCLIYIVFPDPSSKAPARDEGEWTTKTCAFSWAIETTVPTVLKALISSLPHTMRSWFCSNPRLRSRRGNSALASENASAWPSSSAMADFHQGVKRSACADLDNRPQKRNAQTSAGNVSPEDHNSMDLFDDDWGTEDAGL